VDGQTDDNRSAMSDAERAAAEHSERLWQRAHRIAAANPGTDLPPLAAMVSIASMSSSRHMA
jgi:hypothetical protein